MDRKRVLIIDDAMDYRVLLSKTFKQEGCKVFCARDGIEGYVKFFRVKPDLILLDILLPKMRGDIFIQWLRGTAPGRYMPIIVISGHTKMKEYLYQVGVEVFFEKPCPVKDVVQCAKGILEYRHKVKALDEELLALKKRYDPKTFRSQEEQLSEKRDAAKEYMACERCRRPARAGMTRCVHCGSDSLVPLVGE